MKRGVITFVFDDGYEQTYLNVLPILERYTMPAVFALPLDTEKVALTEQRAIRPWQKWLDIIGHGHEIAAHTTSHIDLTSASPGALERELSEPAGVLLAKTLVYPGGAFNETVVQASKKFYSAARTLVRGFEHIHPQDPLALKSFDFTKKNFGVWKANLLALWAFVSNRWLIETYHIVDDAEEEKTHSIKATEFERHVKFVKWLGIPVQTINTTIKAYAKR